MSYLKNVTFPLRATLVTSVVLSALLMVVLIFGLVGFPVYLDVKNRVRDLWKDLARQDANIAAEQVINYFSSAPITLKTIEGLVEEKALNLSATEQILDICYRSLKENSNFTSVYYAKENGDFYAVYREGDAVIGTRRTLEVDGKTKVQDYSIGKNHLWVPLRSGVTSYDPRKRPFWDVGLKHPQGAWTDPYRFALQDATGFTFVLAQKSGNEISGYWAVDFQIDDLSNYLESLKLSNQGSIYILSDDGKYIAQSGGATFKREIDQLLKNYLQTESKSDFLEIKKHILYVDQFPLKTGIPWNIVTLIQEETFLKPVRDKIIHLSLIGLLPCSFFLVASAIFFGKISRRLKELAAEMDAVGRLEILYFPDDLRRSRIREINMMNISANKMKIGLGSFSKYVPVELVQTLLQSKKIPKLGGERKEITILFVDLANFTALSETLSPNELSEILKEFLSAVSDEVHREKGIIDKFMGDAAMALWGAPGSREDHAEAACRAALAFHKLSKNHPHMNHRIGINTGNVTVGNFGSEDRMDFTAIGDGVNIAARLEKVNKVYGTQILIGEQTAKAVEKTMLVRPIDSMILRGRKETSLIFELCGLKSEASNEMVEAIKIYSSAIALYKEGQFAKALNLFEEADTAFGGSDTPSKILIERCRKFLE